MACKKRENEEKKLINSVPRVARIKGVDKPNLSKGSLM